MRKPDKLRATTWLLLEQTTPTHEEEQGEDELIFQDEEMEGGKEDQKGRNDNKVEPSSSLFSELEAPTMTLLLLLQGKTKKKKKNKTTQLVILRL
ncbi:hypothetical protein Tco_1543284 [Tanacetum coccineum]